MKKTSLLFVFLVLLFSCEKEDLNPDYPFTITVKTLSDSTRIPNIKVEILAPTENGVFTQFFEGYTDDYGSVSFEYDKNAVFSVRATRGQKPITYIGCTEVRLEPNKEVFKTVYIRPYDPEAEGCDF